MILSNIVIDGDLAHPLTILKRLMIFKVKMSKVKVTVKVYTGSTIAVAIIKLCMLISIIEKRSLSHWYLFITDP